MREVYAMNETQMGDWKQICATFAKKIDAELLFVNETSCGVQYKNGTFGHIYIDEMAETLSVSDESITEKTELHQALDILTDDEREIVLMSVVLGLNSKEVAKITDYTSGAVRSKLSRSLKKMKDFLGD